MKLIFAALLLASATAAPAISQGQARAQTQLPAQPDRLRARQGKPDLHIEEFVFAGEKALRVRVANVGSAPSGLCVLRLTVRKINGVAVGRTTEVKLPAIAAGKERWVSVNAKDILPNNVTLESTTFRLNVDATEVVAESKEDNNESWHNL
ncbi:MAG: CARDB domain-containing protein [Pyrinomonadaceae bacterium]